MLLLINYITNSFNRSMDIHWMKINVKPGKNHKTYNSTSSKIQANHRFLALRNTDVMVILIIFDYISSADKTLEIERSQKMLRARTGSARCRRQLVEGN